MGIICVFIGLFNGPLIGVIGYYYIMAGVLMIMVGSLGIYLKYRKNSRCPSCRLHLQRRVKYVCPHCNNTLK